MNRFIMDKDGHLTRNPEYYDRLEGREMYHKIGVTVWTMSKTKMDKKYFETESLLMATRIVNTFKVKKNHKIVKVEFEEVGVLV